MSLGTLRTFLGAAATLALVPLAAAPQALAQTAQTTLSFPTWQAEDPSFADFWKGLIKEFEGSHPGVRINMSSIPFNQYVNQITVRFAGGNPPDIVHLPSRNFAQFADKGWLEPLEEQLKGTDILASWTPLQAGMEWNGKPHGVLLMGYGYVLFYNKDLLAEAKVEVPKTPQQLLDGIKKISKPDKGIFGISGSTAEHPNIVPEMSTWVLGQKLDWFKDGKYDLTDPKVMAAVEMYREAMKNAPPGANSTMARQLFIDGKVGFLIDGPWIWATINPSDGAPMKASAVAELPFPQITGGMSNSLHIAKATDPAKKKLAWEFIQLATTPKWQEQYTVVSSAPAARRGVVSAKTLADKPQLKVINDSAEKAVEVFPQLPQVRANYNNFATVLSKAGMRLQSTDDPTEQIMKEAQAELQKRVPLN